MTAALVRRPVAAGNFYPRDARELASTVDALLAEAAENRPSSPAEVGAAPLRALIVPHAGYVYSGPIAASAYVRLRSLVGAIERVVLLGPAHFMPLEGAAVPPDDAWATPLGEVALDAGLRRTAMGAGAALDRRPHQDEHALEVQLPFLQRLQLAAPVLPVAVGDCTPEEAADLMEALAGEGGLLLVSTDLSHYHDRATARRLDRHTADAVLARDVQAIFPNDACGVWALRGIVAWAARRELAVELLDLRTSGDTAGDPGRVVGYGAFAVTG